jgi:pentatricopeptide repeat protein
MCRNMRHGGVAADHFTVVALLTCAANCRHVSVEELQALVAHFEAVGITRNIYVGTAMMQALRLVVDTSGHERFALLEAEAALLRERGVRLNDVAYNTLIRAAWETRNYAKARAAYAQMIQDGVQPTTHVLQALIYIAAEEGRPELAKEYAELKETLWELEAHSHEVGPIRDEFADFDV